MKRAGSDIASPGERVAIEVEIAGLLRGTELNGRAQVALLPPNLELTTSRRLIVLRVDSIDGVESRAGAAQIFLAAGDVIELRGGDDLDEFIGALGRVAMTLPELTISLRSYGSQRAGAGAEQETFFAPLRLALNRAASLPGADAAIGLFTADRLAAELQEQLSRMAASRYPEHPPEMRALEAELSDCAATVQRRLEILGEAERTYAHAAGSQRFVAWRRWAEALLDVFSAHDACWPLVRVALGAAPSVPAEPSGMLARWRSRAGDERE